MSLLDRIGSQQRTSGTVVVEKPAAAPAPVPQAPVAQAAPPAQAASAPPALTPAAAPVAESDRSQLSPQAQELRYILYDRLIKELDPARLAANIGSDAARRGVEDAVEEVIRLENISLSRPEILTLRREVADEIVGYGPIEPLLADDSISEVMINSPSMVFFERGGRLNRSDRVFRDDDHVMRLIEKIVSPLGRRIDESSPMVDARLPDGSRVNAIIPPLAVHGPSLTIRKFSKKKLTDQDLVRIGTMTPGMVEFLRACVASKLNVLVSGGTGSGKTTFLNILSGYIPGTERIVTIEDPAELQISQPNWVSLETRPANIEGKGLVAQRDLVKNALRMRPDRVIIGECRGGEAFDMLQAMNTGHDGSLTTVHANTPRDALSRVENMVLMANLDLPVRAIRDQIASAIHLVIQLSRLSDGSRRITHCTEVVGMEQDVITMHDIFVFEQRGVDENGKVIGEITPSGIRPVCADKLERHGFALPPEIFSQDMMRHA
jgi:pilus assembly protein CpaF